MAHAQAPLVPLPVPGRLAYVAEARALAELANFHLMRPLLERTLPRGSRTVLVLPGFLSGDWATAPLRDLLAALGHRPFGWGLGQNLGLRPGRFEAIEARLRQVEAQAGGPVTLVGWSLGGLYAVELARRHASRCAGVITLASPVSGALKANNAWRLYERVAGHPVDQPPLDWKPGVLPPVPLTAIAARGDGIVHWRAALAPPGPQVENLTVDGCHAGLGWNVAAVRLVAARLARPD